MKRIGECKDQLYSRGKTKFILKLFREEYEVNEIAMWESRSPNSLRNQKGEFWDNTTFNYMWNNTVYIK